MEFKNLATGVWDDFVKTHSNTWINCLSSWNTFFENEFNYNNLSFGVYEDNKLVGVFPLFKVKSLIFGNRLISGPVLDVGGYFSKKKGIPSEVKNQVIIIAKKEKVDCVEVRNPPEAMSGFEKRSDYVDFVLDLATSEEKIWTGLNKKLRNGIRKAQKNIKIEKKPIDQGLDQFYKLYLITMKALGSPPITKKFFQQMNKTKSYFLFAKLGDKIVAAILVNYFNGKAKYEAAVYLPKFRNTQANPLLVYEAILNSKADNMNYFIFGRTQPDSSVYTFKKRWNAVEIPITYYYKSFNGKIPSDVRSSKLAVLSFVWKVLPTCITAWIGNYFRKQLAM